MADFKLEITASSVAWYGAIVATASAVLSWLNFWRDKPKVKITISKNMQIIPPPISEENKRYIMINVANVGRRPVTITHVGFYEIGKEDGGLLGDSFVNGAREIKEGKSTLYTLDQSKINIKKLKRFIVIDATGKAYKKRISRKFRIK